MLGLLDSNELFLYVALGKLFLLVVLACLVVCRKFHILCSSCGISVALPGSSASTRWHSHLAVLEAFPPGQKQRLSLPGWTGCWGNLACRGSSSTANDIYILERRSDSNLYFNSDYYSISW